MAYKAQTVLHHSDFAAPQPEKNSECIDLLYCDNCKWLTPHEADQTSKKEPHLCIKNDIQIKHNGHHPKLPRPIGCNQYEAI